MDGLNPVELPAKPVMSSGRPGIKPCRSKPSPQDTGAGLLFQSNP